MALFRSLDRGMFRCRKLLDLAHRIDICQNCGAHTGGCEPAHSNLDAHGKGFKLKADDCFFAALCHACHAWLDNSAGRGWDPGGLYTDSRADKREMFIRAMHRTWLELWRLNFLKVT